jgi:hypothetical protein
MGMATISGPIGALICGLVGLSILRTITAYAKLSHFKGPKWTGISNWPHSMAMLGGRCHEWYAAVSKEYGMYQVHLTQLFLTYISKLMITA